MGLVGSAAPARQHSDFAGYSWHGRVTSVSAVIVAPRFSTSPAIGQVADWIGAAAKFAFIQAGIIVVRWPGLRRDDLKTFIDGGGGLALSGGVGEYYVPFRSDSEHRYRAVLVERPVHAGDGVRTALSLRHGRWTVTIADPSERWTFTTNVADGGAAVYDEADWLAEKSPSMAYPPIASVQFEHVTLDDHAASAESLTSQALSGKRVVVEPTPLARGGFYLTQ